MSMKRFLIFILFLLAMIMLSSCVSTSTHEQMVQTMKDYHSKRIDLSSIKDQEKFQKDFNDCAEFAIRWYEKTREEWGRDIWSFLSDKKIPRFLSTDNRGRLGEDIGESPSEKHAHNVFRRCMIIKGYEMFW